MSLVRKYFLRSISNKNISTSSYLPKDNWANRAQYYTCLDKSANIQSRVFKYNELQDESRRAMSVVQSLRETNFYIMTKVKDFADGFPTYIPFIGRKYRHLGFLWFQTLDDIDVQEFFTLLELPDTFYSRFQIIKLHVWMLLYHLPQQSRIDRFIRLGVVQAMWEDSQKRAKLVSDININFKQNFRDLYGEFLFSQIFYDYCFNKSDAALTSAVWCNFFNKQNVDPRVIEALVSYIRYQMHNLGKLNLKELNMKEEKGRVWAPVKPQLEEILKMA